MRNIKRIPIVLEKINWGLFLQDTTGLAGNSRVLASMVNNIKKNKDLIKQQWLDNPDWRLGQLLVNKGHVPGLKNIFFVEEDDWLIQHGLCKIQDIKFLGNTLNPDNTRRDIPRYILLKDLDDAHIVAILDYTEDSSLPLADGYKSYFKERLSVLTK